MKTYQFKKSNKNRWDATGLCRAGGLMVLLPFLVLCSATASPITGEQAKKAMTRWVRYRPGAHMGADLGSVKSVKTFNGEDDEALFHVVNLEGGGFIITSTDNRIQPVIAFSGKGSFVEDEKNPFWALLKRDMPQRKAAVNSAVDNSVVQPAKASFSSGVVTAVASASPSLSDAEADWAELLSDDELALPSKGFWDTKTAYVRVPAMVTTKWGQNSDLDGNLCYNYYTPNHYPCGCSATAIAQVMRYHKYPRYTPDPGDFGLIKCWVDDEVVNRYLRGYHEDGVPTWINWARFVDEPSDDTASDNARASIGALCYDVGVMMRMSWSPYGSYGCLEVGAIGLTNVYKYASAASKRFSHNLSNQDWEYEDLENAIYSNLDGGYPVVLQFSDRNGGDAHAVVADGYGVYGNTAFTHLNFGWEGDCDYWYTLPAIGFIVLKDNTTLREYSIWDAVIYNIFPQKTGELLTGYVKNAGGTAVSGASVKVVNSATGETQSTNTNTKGGYAFHVPAGTWTVSVTATGYDPCDSRVVTVRQSRSVNITKVKNGAITWDFDGEIGNSWGNDFTLDCDESDLTSLAITGANSLSSGKTRSYTCTATLASGKAFAVSPTWEITSGAAYATLTADGVLTARDVAEAQSVTLRATYTRNSVTKTVTKVVTIQPKPTVNSSLDNSDLTFVLGGASDWFPQEDTTQDGVDALQSGALGNSQTNWVETSVSGMGTLSFNWMVSSETNSDYLELLIDGVVVSMVSGLSATWESVRHDILGSGSHTICWRYRKNGSDSKGLDAGFLDGVKWEPCQGYPTLSENADPSTVAAALEGSADPGITASITNGATYQSYVDWAERVKGPDGSLAGAAAVQDSPHAWFSYALDSATLIEKLPTADEIAVDEFTPAAESGKFDFTVSVEGVTVGSAAQAENLKRVFGLEGATTPDASGFSAENVDLTFGTPEDGKVKFTAGPKDAGATSFFMRVKVAP